MTQEFPSLPFLKCDAAGCDHREDVAEISADLIGKPCPKCGASLLTERDHQDFLNFIKPGVDMLFSLGLLAPMHVGEVPEGYNAISIGNHNGAVTVGNAIPPVADEETR